MKKMIFTIIASALIGNLFAQEQNTTSITDTTMAIPEVVVVGMQDKPSQVQKLPVPLKDIPISISEVPSSLMKDLGIDNLIDAAHLSTGVRSMNTYGGFQTFRMRGFGNFVIMVDGVRDERHNLSSSAPMTSLAATEKVEFLKGPASVLYGHSALGGVINVVRNQPTHTTHADVIIAAGSWDRYKIKAGAGGAISEKVSIRVDAALEDGDGWRHANNTTANAYLALNYKLDVNNRFEFRLGANNDFYGTETGLPIVLSDIYNLLGNKVYNQGDMPSNMKRTQRYNDPQDFLIHENVNASGKWLHNFNDKWKLDWYLSFSDDNIDYFSTEELTYLQSMSPVYNNYYLLNGNKIYICLDSLQRSSPLRFSHKTATTQNQIDLTGEFKTGEINHKFLGGYSLCYLDRTSYTGYAEDDIWGPGKYAIIPIVNPILNQGWIQTKFSKGNVYHEMVNALYVQDYIEFTKKFRVLAGLRYDYYQRDYQTGDSDGGDVTNKSEKQKQHNHAITWRLGALYQLTNDVSLYASGSNYFKPTRTTFNLNYIYVDNNGKQITPDGDNVFQPETGYQVEVGSHVFVNDRLQFNVAGYYIKKYNMVESLGTYEGKRVYGQVGAADSKGLEMDVNVNFTKGLRLNAGYTFNITKYSDYAENQYAENSLAGKEYTQSPRNVVFGNLFYTIKGLTIGTGGEYASKSYANGGNTFVYDPYFVCNSFAKYKYKNYTVQCNFNNMFDKTYYSTAVYGTQYMPEQGRNVLVSLMFNL